MVKHLLQAPASCTCVETGYTCVQACSSYWLVDKSATSTNVVCACVCLHACMFVHACACDVRHFSSFRPASQRYVRGMLSPPALSAPAIFNSSYYTTILSITVIINLSWLLGWCNVLTSDVETTLWLLKFGWELSHTDIDDVSGGNWELKTLWFMSL